MSKLDNEISSLLDTLYTLQSDVGATEEEGSKTKKKSSGKKGDRFMEVKGDMVERLNVIKELMTESAEGEKNGIGGDPKDVIRVQSQIRENIRMLTEEWRELDGIYRVEARKKRSKFTPEELKNQQHIVMTLSNEITRVKDIQRSGYARGTLGDGAAAAGNHHKAIVNMNDSSLFGGGGDSGVLGDNSLPTVGVEMSSGQASRVQALKERDAKFDASIAEIGRGVLDLQDYAVAQNEEVKRQNLMLSSLEGKIDNVHDHVTNVNTKMKSTLDEVGRRGDKFCVDIICIVLAIGFAAVIYSIYKETN
ncbi:hypothetical protein TrRE_jg6203 [Triparma retinervis]|uniref:t-SNARE coiled-coil homology domain-containing protein n=1 Tax=Triparma retinervis TaxID=2557542 RepID=A0A9W7DS34_9STRA|nr:hypothetical protein TrRE_jg6203 [Triparma retinervis]